MSLLKRNILRKLNSVCSGSINLYVGRGNVKMRN